MSPKIRKRRQLLLKDSISRFGMTFFKNPADGLAQGQPDLLASSASGALVVLAATGQVAPKRLRYFKRRIQKVFSKKGLGVEFSWIVFPLQAFE